MAPHPRMSMKTQMPTRANMSKRIAKAPLGAHAAGVSKVYRFARSVREATVRIFEGRRRLGAVGNSSFCTTAKFLTSLQQYNITASGLSSLISITRASRKCLQRSARRPTSPPSIIVTSPMGFARPLDDMPPWRKIQRTEESRLRDRKWRKTEELSPLKPVDAAAQRRINRRAMMRAQRKQRARLEYSSGWTTNPGTRRMWKH